MPRQIPLVNSSAFALVDDADYAFLMQWQWRLNNKGYAVRSEVIAGKRVYVNMHRVILDAPRGRYVDHIDNNKLNNTRINLRLCTGSQNQANRRLHRNNTSGFKGVTRRGDRWHARIEVNGKSIHLGYHDSAHQASLVYDHAARRYFGDFARLNHPRSPRMEAYEQRLHRILAGEQPKRALRAQTSRATGAKAQVCSSGRLLGQRVLASRDYLERKETTSGLLSG